MESHTSGAGTSFLSVPGMVNLRDLGGIPVAGGVTRAGVLLRSEAPVLLGDGGRAGFAELGIRECVDLREDVERDLYPLALEPGGVNVRTAPIFGATGVVASSAGGADLYRSVIASRQAAVSAAAGAVCDAVHASTSGARGASGAALVCCSAGKDRTGIVVALLLLALGASREDVVAEYSLTESVYRGEFRARIVRTALQVGLVPQVRAASSSSSSDVAGVVMAELQERPGGARGYLVDGGVSEHQLVTLRAALVDPV